MIHLDPLLQKIYKKKIPGRTQLIHNQTFETLGENKEMDIHQMGKDILNSKAVEEGIKSKDW